jgi:hypothetical protein
MKDIRENDIREREKENMPYLLRYRQLLSDKMQESGDFGELSLWTDGDFQRLIDLIQEKTTVILSVSTLKRTLGKQTSKSFPTDATLNTLAKFLIDKDWEEFKNLPITDLEEPDNEQKSHKFITWAVVHRRHLALALSLLVVALVGIALPSPFLKPKGKLFIKYNENKQETMPYTLVLGYELENIDLNEDTSKITYTTFRHLDRTLPYKEGKESFPLYNPDVYYFYLEINNQVVDSLIIKLKTDDWYVISRKSDDMSLFPDKEEEDSLIIKNGVLHFPHPLPKHNFTWTVFSNMGNITNTVVDDMTFEAEVKNSMLIGGITAYDTKIILAGERGEKLQVNFTEKGSDEFSYINFGYDRIKGYEVGRGNLAISLKEWRKIRLSCKDKFLHLYLDGKKIMKIPYRWHFGKLWGIGFGFRGSGMARNIRVYRGDGSMAYQL